MELWGYNTDVVKVAVIAVASPVWIPFVRALWREMNDALREDGGLLGIAPTRQELRDINADRGEYVSPLVNVRMPPPGQQRRAGGAPAGKAPPAGAGSPRPAQGARRGSGFAAQRSMKGFAAHDAKRPSAFERRPPH